MRASLEWRAGRSLRGERHLAAYACQPWREQSRRWWHAVRPHGIARHQTESDTFLCHSQPDSRPQTTRGKIVPSLYAKSEVWSCPLKSCSRAMSSRRIVTRHLHEEALQRANNGPRRKPCGCDEPRGTSIRQFEIPHLRTSTLPAAWTARAQTEISQTVSAYNLKRMVNILGGRKLHGPAGYLILLPLVITRR